jgi:ABC-type multidrug transport system fused ATPase/permease subunit
VNLKNIQSRWKQNTFFKIVQLLPSRDQRIIIAIVIAQMMMGVLDLLGVAAIGLLGTLSVNGFNSQEHSPTIENILQFIQLDGLSYQSQAGALGIFAAFLLIGRTIISILFTRRILYFLSRRGAKISADLVSRMLAQPLLIVQERSTQEILFGVTRGVQLMVLEVLATALVLLSDLSLLVIMGIGLFVLDPVTALGTYALFSLIGFLLYRFMHVRATALGIESSRLNIHSNEKIVEVFSSYRESVVRNRRDYYSRQIGKLRYSLANTTAEINFLPYVSKYVIETSVVLGALLLGFVEFVFHDVAHAVSTLAIFLAAGSRIAPAVLRVQQGSVVIRGSLGAAAPTLELIEFLGNSAVVENVDDRVYTNHIGFVSEIQLSEVTLTYPQKQTPALSNVNLVIPSGTSAAIVGPSGAGKTTLIDVLLGVLVPDAGSVTISGHSPLTAINRWPGAIAYVPQDVVISSGTIRENVGLGYPLEMATDDLVNGALNVAGLGEFVASLKNGLDTEVGEYGAKISGGQRQRLGIARAMFTNPQLLVLDEATSSLDGETEAGISDAIQALRGSTTVLFIAHRLSTVRNADIVFYLSSGKILSKGTFNEVRIAVPEFDRQAKQMGL